MGIDLVREQRFGNVVQELSGLRCRIDGWVFGPRWARDPGSVLVEGHKGERLVLEQARRVAMLA